MSDLDLSRLSTTMIASGKAGVRNVAVRDLPIVVGFNTLVADRTLVEHVENDTELYPTSGTQDRNLRGFCERVLLRLGGSRLDLRIENTRDFHRRWIILGIRGLHTI